MKDTTKLTNFGTRLLGFLVCIALATSMVATPVAAQSDTAEQAEFLVELGAEGDAGVTVTYAYDLETDGERAAFEELQDNETARQELAERFENRMSSVAADTADSTGREMSVSDASVELDSENGVGIVSLSVEFQGLAAAEDGQLTVTEPFASSFETDRPFTVEAPDGYEITSTSPDPSSTGEATATWDAGTSLEGFELVAESNDGGDGDSGTDGNGAGFGAAVAVAALLGAVLFARRAA